MKFSKKAIMIIVSVFVVVTVAIGVTVLVNNNLSDDYYEQESFSDMEETENIEISTNDNLYSYIAEFATVKYPAENSEWKYIVYENTVGKNRTYVELTDCLIDEYTDSITIPSEIEGYPVIRLGEYLLNNYYMSTLIIPDTVISIGKSCCNNCVSLENVSLPNSVTEIEESAFCKTMLKELTLPENIVSIGESAFYFVDSIYSVELPKSLNSVGYNCISAKNITVLNPNMVFASDAFNADIIYGYANSTAAEYCANSVNCEFRLINENSSNPPKSTLEDVENAFIKSITENSIEPIKKHLYPKAYDVLKAAYNRGEDESVIADLHMCIDEFYSDDEFSFDVSGLKIYKSDSRKFTEYFDNVYTDLKSVDSDIVLKNIYYSDFEIESDEYDTSANLFVIETDEGFYILGIDM